MTLDLVPYHLAQILASWVLHQILYEHLVSEDVKNCHQWLVNDHVLRVHLLLSLRNIFFAWYGCFYQHLQEDASSLTCMSIYMYVCMYVCKSIYIYIYIYIYMHIYMHIYNYANVYVYVYICAYMNMYVFVYLTFELP